MNIKSYEKAEELRKQIQYLENMKFDIFHEISEWDRVQVKYQNEVKCGVEKVIKEITKRLEKEFDTI